MAPRAPLAPHDDAETGFSMLELLVSLAILGMMAVTLAGGLVTGRRAWERIETRTAAGEDVTAAQQLLRTMIERLYPQGSLSGSRPFTEFRGEVREVHFQGAAPDAMQPAPHQYYSLSLTAGGDLVLDRMDALAPTPDRPGQNPAIQRRVVIRGVQALEWSYFGAAQPDFRRRWRSRWVDQPTPPEQIRLRLKFAEGDRRHWPEFVAAPAATLDTLCIYVRNTGTCRGRQ